MAVEPVDNANGVVDNDNDNDNDSDADFIAEGSTDDDDDYEDEEEDDSTPDEGESDSDYEPDADDDDSDDMELDEQVEYLEGRVCELKLELKQTKALLTSALAENRKLAQSNLDLRRNLSTLSNNNPYQS
jgi:hypothetical protein